MGCCAFTNSQPFKVVIFLVSIAQIAYLTAVTVLAWQNMAPGTSLASPNSDQLQACVLETNYSIWEATSPTAYAFSPTDAAALTGKTFYVGVGHDLTPFHWTSADTTKYYKNCACCINGIYIIVQLCITALILLSTLVFRLRLLCNAQLNPGLERRLGGWVGVIGFGVNLMIDSAMIFSGELSSIAITSVQSSTVLQLAVFPIPTGRVDMFDLLLQMFKVQVYGFSGFVLLMIVACYSDKNSPPLSVEQRQQVIRFGLICWSLLCAATGAVSKALNFYLIYSGWGSVGALAYCMIVFNQVMFLKEIVSCAFDFKNWCCPSATLPTPKWSKKTPKASAMQPILQPLLSSGPSVGFAPVSAADLDRNRKCFETFVYLINHGDDRQFQGFIFHTFADNYVSRTTRTTGPDLLYRKSDLYGLYGQYFAQHMKIADHAITHVGGDEVQGWFLMAWPQGTRYHMTFRWRFLQPGVIASGEYSGS
eukprot:TRINITY_DN12056_c0_g1_i1.p1 TRINITY_DN12056_c0_g1~~TRINITY_DN12056_c0_g1_i1.p1  ORF type:complete len:478 (+),score=36.08 TRINITY_DN12056_c0_g1_i1:45-1478(+)